MQSANQQIISCLNSCGDNSETIPFPSTSAFWPPFPIAGTARPSNIGGIAFALLPSPLVARMIPNATRQETATRTAITMPAMAPEDRCEDDSEALGILGGLDTSEDEDVVASASD